MIFLPSNRYFAKVVRFPLPYPRLRMLSAVMIPFSSAQVTMIEKIRGAKIRSTSSRTEPLEENTAFVYEEYSETLNAVLSLPVKYRTVIHLYYYEGYSIKEIAAILDTPAATVGTWLARGREKLKTMLKGEDDL